MTTTTAARLLFTGALAVGLALSMPVAAVAHSHLTEPKVTVSDGTSTMVLDSTTDSEQYLPKGGEPTDVFPEGPPSNGDAFAFTEELRQVGALVGTDKGVCTIVDFEADELTCKVAVTLADGTISVVGPTGEVNETTSTYDLVSGTGAYQGIDGTATVVDIDDEHAKITLKYTAAEATQVSEVPAGGAATGGTAATKAPAEPKATKDGDETTIKVHAVGIEDSSGEDEEESEESAPKVGDSFTFEENLTQDGVLVGRDKITCTVTEVSSTTGTLRCEGDLTFAGGSLRIADSLSFPLEESEETEAPFDVDIVSGTGAYPGAKGSAHIVTNSDESSDLTLTFTTAQTPADTHNGEGKGTGATQVSEVPAGGAATGGGGSAQSTDSALLIGVGLAAVAGAGGLFAAARFTGRGA